MNKTQQRNLLIAIVLIIIAAALRLIIDIPNITPIAAIALFGAATIKNKKWAMLLPLSILFISDLIIGFYEFQIMLAVYISFILIVGIGFLIKNKINLSRIAIATISSSILFFIITNLAVWMMWYPKSIIGLLECYTLAIPFFKYEIIGTALFSTALFGSYYFIKNYALKAKRI
jgi:Family of unknown function (DUF6580)